MSTPLRPLKWYRELAGKKARQTAGAFLVEGERAIRQVMALHPREILEVLSAGVPPAAYLAYPVRRLTESQIRYISHSRTPPGVMAVVRAPSEVYSPRLPSPAGRRILLLEDVQDPGNVGTLIRTAAAFDYSGVILTEKCADPLSPKCVQATAGSVPVRLAEEHRPVPGACRHAAEGRLRIGRRRARRPRRACRAEA